MKLLRNPISFTPLPVTIITSVIYSGLVTALLVIHLVVPSSPQDATPFHGINLTEAWNDLQVLTNGFHPYNSHKNDEIRDWLLRRIESILAGNGALYTHATINDSDKLDWGGNPTTRDTSSALIFNDMISNITFASGGLSVYFEGTNIIVYVRGSRDGNDKWWTGQSLSNSLGGVLVNAHYDSVSTGYGATDDGVGVITVLQLIKYYTTPGNQPARGLVALLNNGEEDYLNGAHAFCVHPIATSHFIKTFLNLEGAGAGGRATLFRSTDAEVTKFFQGGKHPFGTVVSADGFNAGFITSQTDYVVFEDVLGLRGLDVAFMEPRARYHTDQDDTRHTNIDSLWHMLSAAISTTRGLTSDTSSTFNGENPGNDRASNGSGSEGVWFDLFGSVFAVIQLHTLFALSVTLLVAAPLVLLVIGFILFKVDRLYLFSASKNHHHSEGDDSVPLGGWRGFFRYPLIFVTASTGTMGLAFLINKMNPFIVYSSPYAVWSMLLSAWIILVWFLSKSTDFVRPSAFHRTYSLIWMFAGGWVALVLVTVSEEQYHLAAGYFIVFYFASIFLATCIALLELFGLTTKSEYANEYESRIQDGDEPITPRPRSVSSGTLLTPGRDEQPAAADVGNGDEDIEVTEATSLLNRKRRGRRSTFAHYASSIPADELHRDEDVLDEPQKSRVYGYEQPWSWSLPGWTWLLQFVLLAFIAIVFVGQIGLLFLSATYQTLADGSSPLTVYVVSALVSLLLLAPLGPFLHRYTYHIPMFLLCVFAGTITYNLLAFPFSSNNRLKLFFIQRVDLDSGINEASLSGVKGPYLAEVISSLPSFVGQSTSCIASHVKPDLVECSWNGLSPRVVPATHPEIPPFYGYHDWLAYNITRKGNEAQIHLYGTKTRNCKILFNRPISDLRIEGAGEDNRFKRVTDKGSKEVRLWHRNWNQPWDVHIKWDQSSNESDGGGIDGRIVCMWNDEGITGTIPALDEIRRFAPAWVGITKLSDGLVEGSKSFLV
ncbi:hypothetical protein MMC19_006534 [Ptychographa xylographoides]|nr:hypothetical protein [Ptychographa xylographoides]